MKIGFIGLGVMGHSMARLLTPHGLKGVFTRTSSKAEGFRESGLTIYKSISECAAESDVVCTMVGYPSEVEDVYLGSGGLLDSAKEGQLFIDFTTSQPALAEYIAQQAEQKGVYVLDAPVSGGDVGAKNGTLSIMVGGSATGFAKAESIFQVVGKAWQLMGGAGAGQHTKMVNQITIAGTMIGVCEALVYAEKAGLDISQAIEAIRPGAAGCWTLDNLAPRIVKGDFEPGFFVDHFIKDMGIALQEAARLNMSLPGLALVHQMYGAVKAQGLGRKGTHALFNAVQSLNGVYS